MNIIYIQKMPLRTASSMSSPKKEFFVNPFFGVEEGSLREKSAAGRAARRKVLKKFAKKKIGREGLPEPAKPTTKEERAEAKKLRGGKTVAQVKEENADFFLVMLKSKVEAIRKAKEDLLTQLQSYTADNPLPGPLKTAAKRIITNIGKAVSLVENL